MYELKGQKVEEFYVEILSPKQFMKLFFLFIIQMDLGWHVKTSILMGALWTFHPFNEGHKGILHLYFQKKKKKKEGEAFGKPRMGL